MSIFSPSTVAIVLPLPKKVLPEFKKSPMMKAKSATPITTINKPDLLLIFSNVAIYLVFLSIYLLGKKNFKSTFIHVFTIFLVVNLYDLIVLDWGIFCHSKKLKIPGTEDMEKEYKDYFFHVKGAFIGIILGLILALSSGCIIHFILKI